MICIFAASVLTVCEKNLDQKQFRNTRTDPGFYVRVCVGGGANLLGARMFLPPANVWGKVMFLLACVILFRGGGEGRSLYDDTSCLVAWSPVPSRGLRLWSHVPSGGGGWSLTPRTVKSGRYTSYWNAFLLLDFQQKKLNQENFSPWRRFGHSPRSANVVIVRMHLDHVVHVNNDTGFFQILFIKIPIGCLLPSAT